MSTTEPKLLQNAIRVPEADFYLVSRHTHDFVTYTFEGTPSLSISCDGGLSYCRRAGDFIPLERDSRYEEWCLTDADPFEPLIVSRLLWGTTGKDGTEPLTFRPIATFTLDHLRAILADCPNIGPWHKRVVEYWIGQREKQPS